MRAISLPELLEEAQNILLTIQNYLLGLGENYENYHVNTALIEVDEAQNDFGEDWSDAFIEYKSILETSDIPCREDVPRAEDL
jgi:hypothetical protein